MTWRRVFVAIAAMLTAAAAPAQDLVAGFDHPPAAARPWVYWFWLNGNITREGITADLEAMKRVGIGGVLIMEVDQGAPVGPMDYVGDKWRELFKFMTAEANRLGLEVNMNDDAGWNGSGGPWMTPELSMQKVVWREVEVEGPKTYEGKLPALPNWRGYARDIAVQAFPATGGYRIKDIGAKALYQVTYPGSPAGGEAPADSVVDPAKLVDLTAKMDAEGNLKWEVPAGRWTIARFGYTSTGSLNAPAPASGRGLECDKCSREAMDTFFAGQMGKLCDDVGPLAGKALVATHIDSWENGAQNWTSAFRAEFQRRRGYDPLPWLACVGGRVIGSLEQSERFLWDLRMTVADLIVENYAGRIVELAHQRGLRYTNEGYVAPTRELDYAGRADEPMCEFWTGGGAFGTVKEMASAAHVYGRPIMGAESFTSDNNEKWLQWPGSIKSLGDRAICDGVQRFVFHRYAMQPWLNYAPGMTMGPWGLHYERTNTWWEQSGPWHTYLARCFYLLRQGGFAADIAYLNPENAPQGAIEHPRRGYDYDCVSAEVLLSPRTSVRAGRLHIEPAGSPPVGHDPAAVPPAGAPMDYRLLTISDAPMTPALLKRVRDLVQAGLTVVGPRPQRSPSLAGYPACDDQVRQLADELWGDCDGRAIHEHKFGAGRVLWGPTPEQALAADGVGPDFGPTPRLNWIHRHAGDTEIYFVANPSPRDVKETATFRVNGRQPELWWPETGVREAAPVWSADQQTTSVALQLPAAGSVFVLFRAAAAPNAVVTVASAGRVLLNAAPTAAPKVAIVIQKAVYGVTEDQLRIRDVKAQVQANVDAGRLTFPVREMADDGDPAPNIVKTLVVDYTVGGEARQAKGTDVDELHLIGTPPAGAKIVITKAVYGVLEDTARTIDAKDRAQKLVDSGLTSFQVARLAEGGDPAYLVVKTAVIDYTWNGHPGHVTGTDPETIVFDDPVAAERSVELHTDPAGHLLLEAARGGRYDLTTAAGATRGVEVPAVPPDVPLAGPWQVTFPPKLGAPPAIRLDQLISWSKHDDPGVKYFSGTATYTTTVEVPAEMLGPGRKVYLDLGKVQVVAEAAVNGRPLGLAWKPPYRLDATAALKAGANTIEVKVTNLWINRMIGDEQLPEDSRRNRNGTLAAWPDWVQAGQPSPTGRFTFTTWRLWGKDSPLQESGLLGPVRLVATGVVAAD
jgi:hypothetical protein